MLFTNKKYYSGDLRLQGVKHLAHFDFIQYLLDENDRTNGRQYVWQLWNLLFLKLWYQNWMAG